MLSGGALLVEEDFGQTDGWLCSRPAAKTRVDVCPEMAPSPDLQESRKLAYLVMLKK